MNTQDTASCRRSSACRAILPRHELERNEAGNLVCRPGKCPKGRNSGDDGELINCRLRLREREETVRVLRRENNRLMGHLAQAEERLGHALQLSGRDIEPWQIKAGRSGPKSETVPILLCSDWHFGAVVRPESVNNLNEYNIDIAHARAERLFVNALKVVDMIRFTASIKRIVVWLGGDLIDNWIHPEQAQTQTLSPVEQVIEVQKAITAGLDYLLKKGDFDEILVPCNHGNHGRTTQKMQSNSHQTSYEWLAYHSLKRHYSKERRIKFQIAESYSLYMDIFGKTLRFMHGDAVKYAGGVGGVHIPLTKWLDRTNRSIGADHTFLGHFHQILMGSNYSVNSSLCGAMAYGARMGYAAEAPQQLLRCINSQRGFTLAAPVFVD